MQVDECKHRLLTVVGAKVRLRIDMHCYTLKEEHVATLQLLQSIDCCAWVRTFSVEIHSTLNKCNVFERRRAVNCKNSCG